uniref:Restriction endonuclease n=1 Tax=Candidatus Kentrum eta TaxID=2126337 RepID=A0A450U9J0_9GAMM|nr:MAG: Putative restriction endonuclease [Candidatus Kentron sp. H]VFJ90823.1 MAG: Putative restriction endonuclease [Candidatus Kentron sp. H]VFJ96933.1 MAG: Putative restriction endonuclease [Candidatus Kentron sp. H]
MQWRQVLADPCLRNLPYKIELNGRGNIEMSPASNRHGFTQTEIAFLLRRHLPHGKTITECAIQTADGVKVADVAWGSEAFFQRRTLEEDPFQQAPEICVEIVSPGNSAGEMKRKVKLYLQQGAREVWLVDLEGNCRFFTDSGEQGKTGFGVPVIAH